MTTDLKRYIDAIPPLIPSSITQISGAGDLAQMNTASLASAAITGVLPPLKLGAFSGDATSSGYTLTLATVNLAPGVFNWGTVNAKGLVTAAANVPTVALSSGTPQPAGTASPGVAAAASRQDHVHPLVTAIAADYEITDATKGVILRSPNGTRWRITVDDSGTLIRTAL